MRRRSLVQVLTVAGIAALGAIVAGDDAAPFRSKLPKDRQVLHALNRLTFGPRPGDVEAVMKTGLKKWVDQQLHPERIAENPELEARLQPLDSLRLEDAELMKNYPPPQLIRAVASGRARLPLDPQQRELYQRLAVRYEKRLKKQGATTPAPERASLAEILSAEEISRLRRGSPEERAALLAGMPEDKLDRVLFALPGAGRQALLAYSPVEVRRKILLNNAPQQVIVHDLWEGKLYRAIYSNRQLAEVLADFWFNHFNVYLDKGADRFLTTSYEREAIRPHVLGDFRTLLQATAGHPAMLWYLDNWQSVSPEAVQRMGRRRAGALGRRFRGLNENYARELLELHTLGVDGGYTQKDIIEVARCFTGWTIRDAYRGGGFEYNDALHDKGEKVVLGVKIPAGGGKEDGLKVLDIVAAHPSTARFISRKLAVRFVADQPPESLVNAMAKTFTRTRGDLREVMRTMVASRQFWSEGAWRAKVKTPLEVVASAVRAAGAEVTFAYGLANRIAELGEPLYRKQEPTGYPAANEEWVSSGSLLARMNFALALTSGRMPGVKVDFTRMPAEPPAVARALLFTDPSPQTSEAIRKAEKKEAAAIAALVLGSPEFQRR
ncbi:MAG: DUF1800 family protein [Acidobacteria bacterium]|nr:DUF1800 family protein [Acidobacteriota bacterium]MBI3281556.1 DUF1800 family protein [Acidobacteriota bacterium]